MIALGVIAAYVLIWFGCAYVGFRYSVAGPSNRPTGPSGQTKWDDVRDGESTFTVGDYAGISLAITFLWPIVAPLFVLYLLAQVVFTAPLVAEDRRREARRENLARWQRDAAYGSPEEQKLARAVLAALDDNWKGS